MSFTRFGFKCIERRRGVRAWFFWSETEGVGEVLGWKVVYMGKPQRDCLSTEI
jgi:hypothetical protein